MKEKHQMTPKNYHLISIRFIGPSNTKGSRVKISSDRFGCSKTLNRDYSLSADEQAFQWLEKHGFNLVGQGETGGIVFAISDTFESFSELEKTKRLVAEEVA